MRETILKICVIALCGSFLSCLAGTKELQGRLRMVTGLLLLLTLGNCVLNLSFDGVEEAMNEIMTQGAAACRDGEIQTREAYRQSITRELQTYIEDKASWLGMELKAEVAVSPEGLPQRVVLYGKGTLSAGTELSAWLQRELGIPKENQLWIGAPSKTE